MSSLSYLLSFKCGCSAHADNRGPSRGPSPVWPRTGTLPRPRPRFARNRGLSPSPSPIWRGRGRSPVPPFPSGGPRPGETHSHACKHLCTSVSACLLVCKCLSATVASMPVHASKLALRVTKKILRVAVREQRLNNPGPLLKRLFNFKLVTSLLLVPLPHRL